MQRSLWLVMALLLVGSFVVAWSVHHSSASGDSKRGEPPAAEQDRIAALGHVDVDKGVVNTYPRQPGLVVWVAAENQVVKAGDRLLQVDDSLARLQLQEARLDLNNAQTQLREAEQHEKLFPYQLAAQKAAAEALEHAYNQVKAENETREKTLSEVSNVTELVRTAMKEGLGKVASLQQVEKAKLEELKLREPIIKIKLQQASDNVEAKKTVVKKAEEALELYKIVARSDGVVLRVLTQEGATLGAFAREAALQVRPAGPLLVRAEILQEWGQLVKEKQLVTLEDDTYQGREWKGEVQSISQWYAPTRSPIIEPFKMNDVRTLECLIRITGSEEGLRIGQRMRVKIKI